MVFDGNFITIKVVNNNLGYNRIGVIIRGGVVKKATKRNSIKRIILNFFNVELYPITPKKDILVIFKKKITNDTYKEKLIEELTSAISKLK